MFIIFFFHWQKLRLPFYKYILKYRYQFMLSEILVSITRRGKINNVPFYMHIFWSYLGLWKSRKWIKTICIISVSWWLHLFLLPASWAVEMLYGHQVIALQRSVIVFVCKASQTLFRKYFLFFCEAQRVTVFEYTYKILIIFEI